MKLLTVKQVAAMLECHESYVWTMARERKNFPKPVALSGNALGIGRSRATRWIDSDIEGWVKSLANMEVISSEHDSRGTDRELHKDQRQEVAA